MPPISRTFGMNLRGNTRKVFPRQTQTAFETDTDFRGDVSKGDGNAGY